MFFTLNILYFSQTRFLQNSCWFCMWSLPTNHQSLLESGQPRVMGSCHSIRDPDLLGIERPLGRWLHGAPVLQGVQQLPFAKGPETKGAHSPCERLQQPCSEQIGFLFFLFSKPIAGTLHHQTQWALMSFQDTKNFVTSLTFSHFLGLSGYIITRNCS